MKYVAYYRVSTKDQYLGLDAQRFAVENYCRGKGEIVKEFEEKESGKNCCRTELNKAIAKTLEINGCLVIAKLDRLSRNVKFVSTLMETGVEFVCCDMPYANKFVIHIMAAFAEDELNRISTRTKETLAVLKRNGVKLGNPYKEGDIKKDGTFAKKVFGVDRVEANRVKNENIESNVQYMNARKVAKDLKKTTNLKYSEIAEKLNEYGFKNLSGGRFNKSDAWIAINKRKEAIPSQYEGRFIYE